MSELNYGVNVENLLHDLSQHESSDNGEFDVYGEDEQGREGCASIDITLLASDALKVIANLKSQHAALLGGFADAIRHKDKLAAELIVMAAENAMLKGGIGFFSYGTDSGFEEHDSAEKAIAAADSDIDYYRGDACDGWSEETDRTVWGVIMQRATVTGLRAVTEDDNCDPSIKEWCDYTLLPNVETPATEAYLNSVRADAVQKLWSDSLKDVGHVLAEIGAYQDASEAAGIVHSEIQERVDDFAAQLRAGKDGE